VPKRALNANERNRAVERKEAIETRFEAYAEKGNELDEEETKDGISAANNYGRTDHVSRPLYIFLSLFLLPCDVAVLRCFKPTPFTPRIQGRMQRDDGGGRYGRFKNPRRRTASIKAKKKHK
jgi:hypothetical protein